MVLGFIFACNTPKPIQHPTQDPVQPRPKDSAKGGTIVMVNYHDCCDTVQPDTTKYGWPKDPYSGSWSKNIIFSTDNPWGKGHLDWGFGMDSIHLQVVFGGSVLKTGYITDSFVFATKHPEVLREDTDYIVYCWDSKKGPLCLMYDLPHKDWYKLFTLDTVLKIYDVIHFW